MTKIASFLVTKRYIILTVMLILTAVSAVLMSHVTVNSDMTKYLPDNSQMREGIDIMNTEFPTSNDTSVGTTYRVMFADLTTQEITTIEQQLASYSEVDSVEYDATSDFYNKDQYTMFVVHTSLTEGSDAGIAFTDTLQNAFTDQYNMYVSSSYVPTFDAKTLQFIFPIAGVILLVVLLVLCASWFEPVLFLGVIGIAVAINLGTNVIFSSVSNITISIAAVMQLVLSMDYSIMLMNRYRQEKDKHPEDDKYTVMKHAIKKSFSSIASSSFTTIVGLLALVFMSFKIGEDLGSVLAKGVFISLVANFTVLPTFILLADNILVKTLKKHFKKQPSITGNEV